MTREREKEKEKKGISRGGGSRQGCQIFHIQSHPSKEGGGEKSIIINIKLFDERAFFQHEEGRKKEGRRKERGKEQEESRLQ